MARARASGLRTAAQDEPRGFTLIELLVVVAIISLLVSLLLPSLGRARELANAVKCASGLRNIMVGVFLYAEDHQQGPGEGNVTFYVLDSTVGAMHPNRTMHRDLHAYVGQAAEIWRCPSDAYWWGNTGLWGLPFTSYAHCMGQFVNAAYTTPRWSPHELPVPNELEGYYLSGAYPCPSPAQQALFWDTNFEWLASDRFWHSEGCNVSFLDGHAQRHPYHAPRWSGDKPRYWATDIW